MTKGKKKQTLSPEELLEQALVPEDEQPYEVPENWVWTRLGNVTTIAGGGTPSSNVKEYYEDGHIPWITPADLSGYTEKYIAAGRKNITDLGLKYSSARLMPKGTVLLSSRAPIGYVAIAANELCTNQGFKNFLPSEAFLPDYLYWYLFLNKDLLESYASGTTFLELSGSKVGLVEFPLAPLAEQQRIVDRIESLFAKLDQAKELVENALDSFETRKAAILHKAFTGELTEKWREEHGMRMDSWQSTIFEKCCVLMQNGLSKRKGTMGKATVVLRLADILGNSIDNSDFRMINLDDKEIEKYSLSINDVLIIRVNGSVENVGKFVLIEQENNWAYCDHLIKARFDTNKVLPKFMLYLSMTEHYKRFIQANMVSSAGQNTISQKSLGLLPLNLPSVREQREIIRILDNFFAKKQKAHELYNIIDRIDNMKKSILARAFRGELGTNDKTDEPAHELLKKVLVNN